VARDISATNSNEEDRSDQRREKDNKEQKTGYLNSNHYFSLNVFLLIIYY